MEKNVHKLGNTSQSIVTVPSSFLTHDLKPVELFTITNRGRYFKERSLFAQARLLNINNNPVKNYRKYDEYNAKKYIPIHKLGSIPPPENSFNPHYKRNQITQYPNMIINSDIAYDAVSDLNKKNLDEDNVNNKFDLFSSINVLQDHPTYENQDPKPIDFSKYKLYSKERYNKDHMKYSKLNEGSSRTRDKNQSTMRVSRSKSEVKQTLSENNQLQVYNNTFVQTKDEFSKQKNQEYALITKLDKNYRDLEDYYDKGCFFGKNNFTKDFRLKLDGLIERINSNYDTSKWGNADHVSLFNKMNDTMFTPITYYNHNHESESALFRYTLQKKIETLTLSKDRKEALLNQFTKTTLYKEIDVLNEGTSFLRPSTEEKTSKFHSEYYGLHKSLKPDDYTKLMKYSLPQINEQSLAQTNKENAFLYEKYNPSKLYSGFPSATLAEFTKRTGEQFSNRAKLMIAKEVKENFKKEIEGKEMQETKAIKFNFQDKSKYDNLLIV